MTTPHAGEDRKPVLPRRLSRLQESQGLLSQGHAGGCGDGRGWGDAGGGCDHSDHLQAKEQRSSEAVQEVEHAA